MDEYLKNILKRIRARKNLTIAQKEYYWYEALERLRQSNIRTEFKEPLYFLIELHHDLFSRSTPKSIVKSCRRSFRKLMRYHIKDSRLRSKKLRKAIEKIRKQDEQSKKLAKAKHKKLK